MIQLYLGDVLEQHENIPDGSVDLILTDPPYGTIKGLTLKDWDESRTSWDIAIDPLKIYEIANRILRKNGRLVLFSQEPYTTRLISDAIPNIPFNYRMVWVKDNFANHLGCKKAPVSYYEDILVFTKKHDLQGLHPLRDYFAKTLEYIGKIKKEILHDIGTRADHVLRIDSPQFALCTEPTYDDMVLFYGLDFMEGFQDYEQLKKISDTYKETIATTFNLWEGGAYKGNVLYYGKDMDGYHPTQKPLALIEDLVRTFSRPGDTVADLTMGSGTTMVACETTGRDGYGIEQLEEFYSITEMRLADTMLL